MNEVYKLLSVKHRTSKKGKEYYIAYIGIDNENSYDVMNILLQSKQVDAVVELLNDDVGDISDYIKVEYDTYNKVYKPVITYGL